MAYTKVALAGIDKVVVGQGTEIDHMACLHIACQNGRWTKSNGWPS